MIEGHPTYEILSQLSDQLKGKKIILAICGSVAAIKSIELARLLIRHGADVVPVMSKAATQLIQPTLLEWATGNKPVIIISGSVEHVIHAGNTPIKSDLMIIYPATANTISKIANGIDDTTVTTFATTALGENIPIIIIPAMHLSMYNHPALIRNIEQLKDDGVIILDPKINEGKAKIKDPNEICDYLLNYINLFQNKKLAGKNILITGGRTVEPIDSFRVITNRSSGKMTAALVSAALKQGANVTLISGEHKINYPSTIKVIEVETTNEMLKEVQLNLKKTDFDIMIASAAVSDWQLEKKIKGKISTENKKLQLDFIPTPKIVDMVKEICPNIKLILFRALPKELNRKEMIKNGKDRLTKANGDLICINPIGDKKRGFNSDTNELILISKKNEIIDIPLSSKLKCGEQIITVAGKL